MPPLILVTGATGYIASLLIPQLLEHGYRVRAMARQPERLRKRGWYKQTEMIYGDVTEPESLAPALDGVHTAYYLIHNMSRGHGYTTAEIEGARNFAEAAERAGVQHIIYLGGLADPKQHIAPHMRSRIETGVMLQQGKVPVTEFRAGVIAGSGSISFEMIRFMTELFPIIPGPIWLKNKSQPIAVQNVIDYLIAALTNPNGQDGVFEIGMPQVFTYQELMQIYARIRGHKRGIILMPWIPVWFMAFGIDLMTPVPYPIAYALVDGLSNDSLILDDTAQKAFPEVKLMDYESTVAGALRRLHPLKIERVWESAPKGYDDSSGVKILKHEGFFIQHCEVRVHAPAEKIAAAIPADTVGENHFLRHSKFAFGEAWMEWRVNDDSSLTQTAYFAPRGTWGFLYWYFLLPLHRLRFDKSIRDIAKKAVVQ
ncbi:MAG: DUF2867 domain-containing protein [Chloroflexi bacterium]|nr:DUF2867 domain-containing protein [Chloroflexota bacterium]MBI3166858.1 DUF2867 domain-containing protein [Chloroflexota bacterium]